MKFRYPLLAKEFGAVAVRSLVEDGVCFEPRHVGPDRCFVSPLGCCVVGELFRRSDKPSLYFVRGGTPTVQQALGQLGYAFDYTPEREQVRDELTRLMHLNDKGQLRTPEQVRAALVEEE
jgi:hypothetical protein